MSANRETVANVSQMQPAAARIAELSGPREVLEELFELLQEYGPMWYTEELHNRTVAALRPQ